MSARLHLKETYIPSNSVRRVSFRIHLAVLTHFGEARQPYPPKKNKLDRPAMVQRSSSPAAAKGTEHRPAQKSKTKGESFTSDALETAKDKSSLKVAQGVKHSSSTAQTPSGSTSSALRLEREGERPKVSMPSGSTLSNFQGTRQKAIGTANAFFLLGPRY
jgi:hypothetical protein